MLDIIKKSENINKQEVEKIVRYITWNWVYLSDPKILKKALEYSDYLDSDFIKIVEERLLDKRSLEEIKEEFEKLFEEILWSEK